MIRYLHLDEFNLTTRLLQLSNKLEPYMLVVIIIPYEPDNKNYVINYGRDTPLQRRVTAIIRDPKRRTTYQAVVDLQKKRLESFLEHKNVQPSLTFDEMIAGFEALRTSEAFLAALMKRNIKIDEVVFYPFTSGYRDERDAASKRRIFRPHAAVRKRPEDNFYAHHIEGLVINVDVDSFTVDVEDHNVQPQASRSGNYDPEGIKSPNNVPYCPSGVRTDLKPFVVTQPEGASFQLDGHQVSWQKWRFRVGFNVREGSSRLRSLMN